MKALLNLVLIDANIEKHELTADFSLSTNDKENEALKCLTDFLKKQVQLEPTLSNYILMKIGATDVHSLNLTIAQAMTDLANRNAMIQNLFINNLKLEAKKADDTTQNTTVENTAKPKAETNKTDHQSKPAEKTETSIQPKTEQDDQLKRQITDLGFIEVGKGRENMPYDLSRPEMLKEIDPEINVKAIGKTTLKPDYRFPFKEMKHLLFSDPDLYNNFVAIYPDNSRVTENRAKSVFANTGLNWQDFKPELVGIIDNTENKRRYKLYKFMSKKDNKTDKANAITNQEIKKDETETASTDQTTITTKQETKPIPKNVQQQASITQPSASVSTTQQSEPNHENKSNTVTNLEKHLDKMNQNDNSQSINDMFDFTPETDDQTNSNDQVKIATTSTTPQSFADMKSAFANANDNDNAPVSMFDFTPETDDQSKSVKTDNSVPKTTSTQPKAENIIDLAQIKAENEAYQANNKVLKDQVTKLQKELNAFHNSMSAVDIIIDAMDKATKTLKGVNALKYDNLVPKAVTNNRTDDVNEKITQLNYIFAKELKHQPDALVDQIMRDPVTFLATINYISRMN